MGLLTSATALVAYKPLPAMHGRYATAPLEDSQSPSVFHGQRAKPVSMFLPPVVRGAVVGGAAVGLVTKLWPRPKFNADKTLAPVTKADVTAAQKLWAESIASISKVYADQGDFVAAAGEAAGKLYGYGHGSVLFKPTKATDHPFRATGEEAMSYFVGAEAMKNDAFKGEDAGFAINGGRGWKSVTFRNHQVECYGTVAHAMGDYVWPGTIRPLEAEMRPKMPIIARRPLLVSAISAFSLRSGDSFLVKPNGSQRSSGTGCG